MRVDDVDRHDLALHAWLSGQLLEPEHFERQEQVLLAHMAARLRLTGLPAYGIACLELDHELLEERIVAIKKFEWLLRDGRFFSTEGNVRTIAPLPIEEGRTNVAIHAALMPPAPPQDGAEASHLQPGVYRIELMQGDPPWGNAAIDLHREESMKLLTLTPRKDGKGFALGDYVPPLMHISTTPFLRDDLIALYDSIEDTNTALLEHLRATSSVGARDTDARRQWLSGQKLRALLAESAAVHTSTAHERYLRLHPFWLFSAVRDYACEVAVSNDFSKNHTSMFDPESAVYDHDDLRRSFGSLLRTVTREGTLPRYRPPSGLSFQREGRLFVVRDLPDAALADDSQLRLRLLGNVDASEVVLGSPRRLQALHAGLLQGIALHPDARPADDRLETRYYRLDCRGEEWRHVQRERALCFQRIAGAPGLQAELLWRDPRGAH